MSATLYNLLWAYPLPPSEPGRVQLSGFKGFVRKIQNVFKKPDRGIPAVILYPAILTPDVVVKEPKIDEKNKRIEILVVLKEKKDIPKLLPYIWRQLRITKGLDTAKRGRKVGLFPAEFAGNDKWIEAEHIGGLNKDTIYATTTRFAGIVDKRTVKFWNKAGYKHVYRISIHADALKYAHEPKSDVFAESDDTEGRNTNIVQPNGNDKDKEREGALFHQQRMKPKGVADRAVYSKADNKAKEMHFGRYGFIVGGDDVRVGELDPKNPVQLFHPVFVYEDLKYANIGHMSDIHINSRQQVLANSLAKVIPQKDDFPEGIGHMLNIASANTKELLTQYGKSDDVHMVTISGDVVDFLENTWHEHMAAKVPESVRDQKIREICSLEERKGGYKKHYKENVDLLVLYSLVTDLYGSKGAKPVYTVSGNHDCYLEPVGVFPKLKHLWTDKFIPASHNLTIYEAALSFGKSYHRIVRRSTGKAAKAGAKWGGILGLGVGAIPAAAVGALVGSRIPDSASRPDSFAWFYRVLTPFSDFSIQLPNQYLVGLGWGDEEHMLGGAGEQPFMGHLPLATDSISQTQLDLIRLKENAQAADKLKVNPRKNESKTILFSHFTFASYENAISEETAQQTNMEDHVDTKSKDFKLAVSYPAKLNTEQKKFTLAEMATFRLHRRELYEEMVQKGKIQCILTGHSHRRAIYTLGKKYEEKDGRWYRPSKFFPMPDETAGRQGHGPFGGLRDKYDIVATQGDGNCLFRAVAQSRDGRDKQGAHLQLRQTAVEHMSKCPDDYTEDNLKKECPSFSGREKYLKEMKQDASKAVGDARARWGGYEELRALSAVLKRPIHVYQRVPLSKGRPLAGDYLLINGDKGYTPPAEAEPIRISYNGENHYSSILPKEGQTVRPPVMSSGQSSAHPKQDELPAAPPKLERQNAQKQDKAAEEFEQMRKEARKLAGLNNTDPTWIIVSDSSGSLPRRNRSGEFGIFGSGQSSGVKIVFDDEGNVKKIGAVPIGKKPRFVVAVDYVDANQRMEDTSKAGKFLGKRGSVSLVLGELSSSFEQPLAFELNSKWLRENSAKFGFKVECISLYHVMWGSTSKIKMNSEDGNKGFKWSVAVGDAQLLEAMYRDKDRQVFMAVKFGFTGNGTKSNCVEHYDFETPWTFEVRVKRNKKPLKRKVRRYVIRQDKKAKNTIEPDFKLRGIEQ